MITIKRRFEQERLDKATDFIEQQIKVVLNDSKEYVGKLKRVEQDKIYIDRSIEGGILQVGVARNKIAGFYVYRQY